RAEDEDSSEVILTCGSPSTPPHLNELRPGLQYRMVSQTGPVHAPVFSIAVEVNGLTFEGTGPTKKKAKMRAAELAHLISETPHFEDARKS
uniref:Adenosine deaminase RNA specific B2 (inactive) n=1 Tax=Acanthochromis polyacanthus TaxID=80966 RepID=A0A3Q1GDL4_9TELE